MPPQPITVIAIFRRMKTIFTTILLAFVALQASATSVDPVSVDNFARESEIIVIGQVVSGHVLATAAWK